MARIYRISGSTQYLINGTWPVQGKKLTSLEEIQHFYNNHEGILAETKTTIARQYDEIILGLGDDEVRLDRQLQDNIARTTTDVDAVIHELERKSMHEPGLFSRTGCRVRYWIAVALRNRHIHNPHSGMANELDRVRNRKRQQMITKESHIQRECNNIIHSYEFLKENETFLIGAQGEEAVIEALAHLPDEYHILNDVNLRFSRAIHWSKANEYIKTCQIDHIVAGPTGIFLLETKNWNPSKIEQDSEKLLHQVQRAGLALWYYTKDYYGKKDRPKIWNVVVSLNGSPAGRKLNKYTDVITPYQLCRHIMNRDKTLPDGEVDKFVKIILRAR
jgi:hypothetical protein